MDKFYVFKINPAALRPVFLGWKDVLFGKEMNSDPILVVFFLWNWFSEMETFCA